MRLSESQSAPCSRRLLAAIVIGLALALQSVQGEPAFRAVWADGIYEGFKTTAQIDAMVNRAVQGRYNAIVAQVMNYQEASGYRGAYWNSTLVPKAPAAATGLDPLAYLCTQAHAAGIEVHAWLVTYRASNNWPPTGNSLLAAHPEWFTVPLAAMGNGPALIDGHYFLDPGSPAVQEHLISIVRELVTNYPIDGINWDYIRYTQKDSGYPADADYEGSGLARFRRITGYVSTPSSTDGAWSDFRRRTIDELIRRCRAEIPSIATNPRQPLRHTADLFCAGDAPTNFTSSSAYSLHQNWKYWMEQGWLDAGMPMNYKDESNPTHAGYYRHWIDAAVGWRAGRHVYCGQGNYLNPLSDSITQMQYVYNAGANGCVNYSYYTTTSSGNDWNWYPYVAANIYTDVVSTPTMPWRNPATATEGTLWGQVTDATTGEPVDDATVQAGTMPAVYTDGNGYYVMTRLPATAGGTAYDVTASATGYLSIVHPGVAVVAGDIRRHDLALGEPPDCVAESITGFEGYTLGSQAVFRSPRYSGSTDAHLTISPNTSEVTGEIVAFDGTQCCKLAWQFVDTDLSRWVRVTTSNTANKPNPTIDLSRPVRVRLRLDTGSFRVTLGVRETGTTANIGDDGGNAGTIEWVGAASKIGSAPQGRLIAVRPGLWQTLVFDPIVDPVVTMTGDGVISSPTGKGTIENLGFASTGAAGPFTVYVDAIEQLCPGTLAADFDDDSDVDGDDLQRVLACLNGADLPPRAPLEQCYGVDLDGDGDADLSDFGIFQRCLSGSGIPADFDCMK